MVASARGAEPEPGACPLARHLSTVALALAAKRRLLRPPWALQASPQFIHSCFQWLACRFHRRPVHSDTLSHTEHYFAGLVVAREVLHVFCVLGGAYFCPAFLLMGSLSPADYSCEMSVHGTERRAQRVVQALCCVLIPHRVVLGYVCQASCAGRARPGTLSGWGVNLIGGVAYAALYVADLSCCL
jgi:hypothetical protein